MLLEDEFTIAFIAGPERRDELLNAFSSMTDLAQQPSNVLLIFNPFHYDSHDFIMDMADIGNCEVLKFNEFHSISQVWNLSLMLSKTRYVLLCNDDIIFQDEDCLDKILKKHKEGYKVVHATENMSATSIDKQILLTVGWFDERFWHSWEDIDFRWRCEQLNEKSFRFEPHLIRHLNSPKGRRVDFWDKSSEFFFRKWDIPNIVSPDNPSVFDSSRNRKALQKTGFFRTINSKKVKQKLFTPDFYPHTTDCIRCHFS